MKISFKTTSQAPTTCDLLACFAYEGKKPQLPAGVRLASKAAGSFSGEFRALRVHDASAGPAERVLLVGLGKKDDLTVERLRRAAALAVKQAESERCAKLAQWWPGVPASVASAAQLGTAVAEAAVMATYRNDAHKSKPPAPKLKSTVLHGPDADFRRGAKRGEALGEANLFTRDLQNAPGNKLRPRDMATTAQRLARGSERISCKVLTPAAMKELGMGALLSVAAGSSEPPRLIHLTYKPRGRSKGCLAFVGKGLTFDAGGISLKPAARMWDMKFDMSGGAAVLGAFHALAKLDVPFEVHGVVPSSENMPDASATKPGDVVTAMNGKTIEVLNTDAEGRLILCDALAYTVKKIKPDTIIDLATLTGAVVMALGHELSGCFATSTELRDDLIAAGEATQELVWPLPLLDLHKDAMKGDTADLKNIGSSDLGAGSTQGAAFLAHFVEDVEWAHLDIAGTAWGGRDRDYTGGSQGSGVGVRLLMEYLARRS